MVINQTMKQPTERVFPQSTLQAARDLVYQGKGSIIPQFRKHFKWDSLMVARFTDTHEGAPDVLDLIAFNDPEEKRYLLEMYLESRDIPVELERRILDENLFLVIAIRGTYNSSKLVFLTRVDRLENPLIVESIYDRYLLAESIFLHSRLNFQCSIRR